MLWPHPGSSTRIVRRATRSRVNLAPAARSACYRCHKPTTLCVCGDIARVVHQTRVHILQHKRERFHPLGTARFARLGLTQARVFIDDPRERDETRRALIGDDPSVGVLFPSARARLLSSLAPEERPRTLIVLDGTWSHAKSLVRDNRWLDDLPHYALSPAHKSQYRIRTEPFDAAVSTIEAVVEALGVLEPELVGLDGLVRAFVRMIDRQIELGAQRTGRARNKKARSSARAVPAILRERPSRTVLVFGELSAPPGGGHHALVSWCALRLADGATFETWLKPVYPVPELHLAHMGFERPRLEAGIEAAALAAAWATFVRPDDVLVAWNQSTLTAARELIGATPAVALKAVYANARRTGAATGSLAEIAAREALVARAVPFAGRAQRVLGLLAPLVDALTAASADDPAIAGA